MTINIYAIAKNCVFDEYISRYIELLRQFNIKLVVTNIYTKEIKNATKSSTTDAKKISEILFNSKINENSFILSEYGREYKSEEFANLIEKNSIKSAPIQFFIGGAYGFSQDFLNQNKTISLGKLTFSHDIAKLVLAEQIYRSACINNGHPYHKI